MAKFSRYDPRNKKKDKHKYLSKGETRPVKKVQKTFTTRTLADAYFDDRNDNAKPS